MNYNRGTAILTKEKPKQMSAACLKGNHGQCYAVNCTCVCHSKGAR